jgi:hypothetical protein
MSCEEIADFAHRSDNGRRELFLPQTSADLRTSSSQNA